MTVEDQGQVTQDDLSADDLTEEDLKLLDDDSGEPSSEPSGSEPSEDNLDSRIKAAKIDVSEIPAEIRESPTALESFVSAVEERQKDFQRQWTRKNQEFSEQKSALEEKAQALDILLANPDFQRWAEDKMNQSTDSPSKTGSGISFEDAPAGLKGEALIDWFIDKKLEQKGLLDVPQRLSAMSRHINQAQLDNLRARFPDFQEKEQEIAQVMQARGVNDPVTAYKIVKAENTPDESTLREQIKSEMMKEIQEKKKATGPVGRGGRGGSAPVEPFSSEDIRNKSYDELFESVVDTVRQENAEG